MEVIQLTVMKIILTSEEKAKVELRHKTEADRRVSDWIKAVLLRSTRQGRRPLCGIGANLRQNCT